MTREEKIEWLKSLPGEMISPYQLAVVTGESSYGYNVAAKEGRLNLPHEWRGRNLRIWKWPVIKLLGGEEDARIQNDENDNREENLCQDEPGGNP